jgi:hypothetical protein
MRASVVLAVLPFVLAGCAGAPDADSMTADVGPFEAAAPEAVSIHDVLDLVAGNQRTWTFQVEPGATTVEMRFFATGNGVPGTGLPTCLTIETPAGNGASGSCQGGQGNVNLSPYVVMNERVFYEDSGDVPVGTYKFTLNAQPSTTDFHAVVTVAYD